MILTIYMCVYLYVSSEIEVKNINVIGKSDKTGEIVGYLGDFNEYEIFFIEFSKHTHLQNNIA